MGIVFAGKTAHKNNKYGKLRQAQSRVGLTLLACLLCFSSAGKAQTTPQTSDDTGNAAVPVPAPSSPALVPSPAPVPYARRAAYGAAVNSTAPAPVYAMDPRFDRLAADLARQLDAMRDQSYQKSLEAQQNFERSLEAERNTRNVLALLLAVFAVAAALLLLRMFRQSRAREEEIRRAVEEAKAIGAKLEQLGDARMKNRNALPALLQQVGDAPLMYQEEGSAFNFRAQAILEDIEDLAYVGQGRLAFQELNSESEAAVYLNGLLLSAVSYLNRMDPTPDPWTALVRLEQFFSVLRNYPNAVERRRIAQAHSYRALAGYQVLLSQEKEPSWLWKAERAQLSALSRDAFADVSHAAAIDPDWKHTSFVEALLCSRYYIADGGTEGGSRNDLYVRGLRRAVGLYRGLIEDRAYRGPARRNLLRCLKQIAEHTGEKGDFSDFGHALNTFPSDEELTDEALAARQPSSQDRFLWQWLIGDEELFGTVERLNLAEYRAFWIRMLDAKVQLRNWRSDLAELQKSRPAMREWTVQLLQPEPPISLASALSRRPEKFDQARFEAPASGS
jgi:hypothetical protein